MSNTFVNGESQASIRTKLNATTLAVESIKTVVAGQVTVTNTSWASSGNARFPYKKNAPIVGIVATDKPINLDFTLATYAIAEVADIKYVECYDGGLTLYATSIPTGSVIADYSIRKA